MALVPRKFRPCHDITTYELAQVVQLILAIRAAGDVLYLTEDRMREMEPSVARHFWPNHSRGENVA